jgi:hypothetical protein
MKKPPAVQAAVQTAADVLAKDEHAGKGGSYVFDPGTGLRTPTPETAERHQAEQAAQSGQAEQPAEAAPSATTETEGA